MINSDNNYARLLMLAQQTFEPWTFFIGCISIVTESPAWVSQDTTS